MSVRSKGKRMNQRSGGKRGKAGHKLTERRRERQDHKREDFELAKTLPGPSQLERVRAARAIIQGRGSEVLALQGFMAILHPEVGADRVRELVADLKHQGKR